eukprot:GHRR01033484.1.p1 GENE.GHRR01033484.1~~GHRR01033484.1.p1  ORF type:complete len:153 (-),score=32.93 GHRR01033484.1:920-1378(-)
MRHSNSSKKKTRHSAVPIHTELSGHTRSVKPTPEVAKPACTVQGEQSAAQATGKGMTCISKPHKCLRNLLAHQTTAASQPHKCTQQPACIPNSCTQPSFSVGSFGLMQCMLAVQKAHWSADCVGLRSILHNGVQQQHKQLLISWVTAIAIPQ